MTPPQMKKRILLRKFEGLQARVSGLIYKCARSESRSVGIGAAAKGQGFPSR